MISKLNKQRHPGFTLIEMLVVIAIIALLASILVPAVTRALRSAKSIASVNNLRQIHLMFTTYLLDNNQKFMTSVHSGDQQYDWPRVLWEHNFGEFGSSVTDEMEQSDYRRVMWCPLQVAQFGQDQHPWGRSSYAMNRYFQPGSWGGGTRYSDHPETIGSVEPLVMAGTQHPADPRFGTFSHIQSSNYPYDTAWMNVYYGYGGNGKHAVALWLAGNASTITRERMVALNADLSNFRDFK